jgi:hypothetical protein
MDGMSEREVTVRTLDGVEVHGLVEVDEERAALIARIVQETDAKYGAALAALEAHQHL